MFNFPSGLYTDVRIEDVVELDIEVTNGVLKSNKRKKYIGAFVRVFDGDRWYYSSTTEVDKINEEIESLARMAKVNDGIEEHPVVKAFEVNQEEIITHNLNSIEDIDNKELRHEIWNYANLLKEYEIVKYYRCIIAGQKITKSFYSSKGAEIKFDKQSTRMIVLYSLSKDDKKFDGFFVKSGVSLKDVVNLENELREDLEKSIKFLEEAEPIVPGKYPVILSPEATGIFAHESFGHKSEADLILGSEAAKEEWAIGKTVGYEKLSIADSGNHLGRAWVPFDDEGNRATKTYLIKDGKLTGRLHSTTTAVEFGELPTGNARAMNFEYEPIVRMTTTLVEAGELTKEELIEGIDEGVFVETVMHGSGMSDFTMAPSRAYMIRKGKIAEPVKVSVVTGNVMRTLYLIDGISKDMLIAGGGCGKMEQMPLPVNMGGPYIRIKELDVQ